MEDHLQQKQLIIVWNEVLTMETVK